MSSYGTAAPQQAAKPDDGSAIDDDAGARRHAGRAVLAGLIATSALVGVAALKAGGRSAGAALGAVLRPEQAAAAAAPSTAGDAAAAAAGEEALVAANSVSSECSLFDDDSIYPFEYACQIHDVDQCHACLPSTAHTGSASCFDVCGATCDYAAAGYDDVPDYAANVSYTMVCAWMAIADLPTMCAGSFVPALPTSSNAEPYVAFGDQPAVTHDGNSVDACVVHSYCDACVDADGTENDYCAAVFKFYDKTADAGYNGALRVLNDQAYWCGVIDADGRTAAESIKAGTFNSTCNGELKQTEPGSCF